MEALGQILACALRRLSPPPHPSLRILDSPQSLRTPRGRPTTQEEEKSTRQSESGSSKPTFSAFRARGTTDEWGSSRGTATLPGVGCKGERTVERWPRAIGGGCTGVGGGRFEKQAELWRASRAGGAAGEARLHGKVRTQEEQTY